MTAFITIALTIYAGPYVGQPLFCGGYYDDASPPWVAMPYRDLGVTWECGDRIGILADGELRVFTAMDAEPFGAYCVMQPDGECLGIGADVPKHLAWFYGSTTGRVWNVTWMQKVWEQYRD